MFQFIKIDNTNLICYQNGTILRQHIRSKKWSVCEGHNDNRGYLTIGINKRWYKCHRVIALAFKIIDIHSPYEIDHRDRNKKNNCVFNLRKLTNHQNKFNTSAKGISWCKDRNKWEAKIQLNGKTIHLGRFKIEEEAKQAYLDAKKVYHTLPV